jgi:predicted ATPase
LLRELPPSVASDATLSKLRASAEGNPLYLIELARSVAGMASRTDVVFPETVERVLAARIDRLPEREKRLLQVASVIGKDFPEPLLAAVAELPADELKAALAALHRAEFIHEQAIYPVAEYAFKHPLTQEVALGSQLKERVVQMRSIFATIGKTSDFFSDLLPSATA